eukprot:gene12441-8530_t
MICDRLFARHRKRILGLSLLFLVVYYFLTVRELSKSDRKLGDLPLSLTTTTSPQPRPQTKRPDRNPHYYIGDDFDEPLEVVENEELTREDLQHFPFPFNVGYTAFVGLQLNSFTTSGVAVAPWEREALIQYTMSKGEWNDTYPIAREIFPRLIQGDNLYVPSNALTPFDRYFVKQIPTNVFRRSLCDNLIRLLKVPNLPPLVVNMYTVQVGKFTLRCLYHRREELAEAPRSFVLLTSEGDVPAAQGFFRFEEMTFYPDANISFLLHHPLLKHWYSVNGNIRHPKFTAIPIGARFFHVSHGRNFLPPSDLTRGKEQFFEAEHHLHMRMFLMHLDLNKIFPHIQHTLKLGRRSCTWIEDALEIFADTSLNPNVTWIPIEKLPTRISTIYIVLMPLLTGGTTIKNGHKPSLTSESELKYGRELYSMKQYIVDAFTETVFGGNPAAVLVLEEPLDETLMRNIARENNLSETAFAVRQAGATGPSGEPLYHLRWLTPHDEVDLCGHATLATSFVITSVLCPTGKPLPRVSFNTLSGLLTVSVSEDGLLTMDLPLFDLTNVPVTREMTHALGGIEPVEAYLGRDLVCVVPREEDVRKVQPDLAKLQQLDGLLCHVTAKATSAAMVEGAYHCVSRSFAPKHGIPEDPVCGSGHCHIAPLWRRKLHEGVSPAPQRIKAFQASHRGGTLYCDVRDAEKRMSLGGKAVLFATSELNLNFKYIYIYICVFRLYC